MAKAYFYFKWYDFEMHAPEKDEDAKMVPTKWRRAVITF